MRQSGGFCVPFLRASGLPHPGARLPVPSVDVAIDCVGCCCLRAGNTGIRAKLPGNVASVPWDPVTSSSNFSARLANSAARMLSSRSLISMPSAASSKSSDCSVSLLTSERVSSCRSHSGWPPASIRKVLFGDGASAELFLEDSCTPGNPFNHSTSCLPCSPSSIRRFNWSRMCFGNRPICIARHRQSTPVYFGCKSGP